MEHGEMNIEAAMLLMPFESGVALGDEGVISQIPCQRWQLNFMR